jgi:tRNA(Ile)-lysidine synthase
MNFNSSPKDQLPGAMSSMKRHPAISEKFIRTLQRHGFLRRGEKVLVAVSGGADSVALLHLYREIQSRFSLELEVAHFNHRWRGRESEEDEEFVRQMARHYGLEIQVEQASRNSRPVPGENLEEAAREERYDFLTRRARKVQAQKVALGHTRNDQTETILMRLIRGSGSTGLAGIPPYRPPFFIRPLLGITREEIISYLSGLNVPWREDSSNASPRFLRNRVRHHLIPILSGEYNPRILDRLAETAEILRAEREALEQLAQTFLAEHARKGCQTVELPVGTMEQIPFGLRCHVLRQALLALDMDPAMLSVEQTGRVLDLLQPGKSGKTFFKGNLKISREFQWLILGKPQEEMLTQPEYSYWLTIPGECHIQEAGVTVRSTLEAPKAGEKPVSVLFLNRENLDDGIEIRNWRPGDAYWPQGHSARKKIKSLLQRSKVPRHLRFTWPVYLAGSRVVKAFGFKPKIALSLPENNPEYFCVYLEEVSAIDLKVLP